MTVDQFHFPKKTSQDCRLARSSRAGYDTEFTGREIDIEIAELENGFRRGFYGGGLAIPSRDSVRGGSPKECSFDLCKRLVGGLDFRGLGFCLLAAVPL